MKGTGPGAFGFHPSAGALWAIHPFVDRPAEALREVGMTARPVEDPPQEAPGVPTRVKDEG